jgi:hypothetical protein
MYMHIYIYRERYHESHVRKKLVLLRWKRTTSLSLFYFLKIRLLFDPMKAMISDSTYIGVNKESNDGRKCGELHGDKID